MAKIKDTVTTAENTRTRIITQSCRMFFSRGIKDVKMDDIAKELQMSKRTIYELFPDKRQLLFECLRETHNYLKQESRPFLKNKDNNTLNIILQLYNTYFNLLSKINKKFFIELSKYPEVVEKNESRRAHHKRVFKAWMHKAVDEGLFRTDTNIELLVHILWRNLEMLAVTEDFPQYSAHELGRMFILFYLRGITTEKGQKIIEEYIQKTENKEQ